jgi:hypothetical protein
MQVSIVYAFLAGIISFLSPCVLPLVPGYVSMLSGIGVEQLRAGQPARNSLFASSLAFVSGFSVVFISFGHKPEIPRHGRRREQSMARQGIRIHLAAIFDGQV